MMPDPREEPDAYWERSVINGLRRARWNRLRCLFGFSFVDEYGLTAPAVWAPLDAIRDYMRARKACRDANE